MKILSYDPKKGKKIDAGNFNSETKTFIKVVNRNHYFRLREGYGISEDVILQLTDLACKTVCIANESEIKTILFEFVKTLPSENFGNGNQKFISWKKMSVYKSPQIEFFNDNLKMQKV